MSGRQDPRLPGALGAAFDWVSEGIESLDYPASFAGRLRDRVAATRHRAEAWLVFPPVAIPLALAGDAVAASAACTALYLAADLTGDAQAGDLAPDREGGWRTAIAGGHAFGFLAQSFATGANDPAVATALARTLAWAGARMAGGQARDLAAVFPNPWVDEGAALAIAEQKTGAAFGAYAQVAAMTGGIAPELWGRFWEWGQAVGCATQLITDLDDLLREGHDLAARRLTLPLLHALATLPGPERMRLQEILASAPGPADAQARALIVASGAPGYTAARAALLQASARAILDDLWLPWGARPLLEAAAEPFGSGNLPNPESVTS